MVLYIITIFIIVIIIMIYCVLNIIIVWRKKKLIKGKVFALT